MKLLPGEAMVVASHNAGKVREILDLLRPYGVQVRSAAELGLAEPDETGCSFAENALLKARAAAAASGISALADDSGLSVTALHGEPGIFSARWAGAERNFAGAMAMVQHKLEQVGAADYSAKFVCALALAMPGGDAQVFEGVIDGHLVLPRGNRGFGYDPIFVPQGFDLTFGEMDPAQKHAMSHRARAFKKFIDAMGPARLS